MNTTHQAHRIVNTIGKTLERKEYCNGVFLDVSQALDKVWHALQDSDKSETQRTWETYKAHDLDILTSRRARALRISKDKIIVQCVKGEHVQQIRLETFAESSPEDRSSNKTGKTPLAPIVLDDFKWTCLRCGAKYADRLDPKNNVDFPSDEEEDHGRMPRALGIPNTFNLLGKILLHAFLKKRKFFLQNSKTSQKFATLPTRLTMPET
ncbi:hypothetical protein JTB14_012861 [Gonioctena quinquepunctata]|nr:hypothetical protein JTB14_012861 [Gonioctena quinquepunctata]